MDSFANQMNYKFTPGRLLMFFVFVTLFYNQRYFTVLDHDDNLHDKRRIQAKMTHVDNNHKADDVKRTIFTLKYFQ